MTTWDDIEPAPVPVIDWNPIGPTPAPLRDYWLVHAHAVPLHDAATDTYSWRPAPGEWLSLDPPAGVIPPELYAGIRFINGKGICATAAGAKALLQVAILRRERKPRAQLYFCL